MRVWKSAGLSLLVAVGVSCGDDQRKDDVGEVQIALTEIPTGVACLQVTAAGSRVVTKTFPAFAGMGTTVTMGGLPTGDVSFTAAAFSQMCNAISGATPTWIGGPVNAQVTTGMPVMVQITMVRNGQAKVGIDFNDPMCTIAGDVCTADAMCCQGANLVASCQAGACAATCNPGFGDCNANIPLDGCETNLTADINNCGSCGVVCPFGCISGFCINSTLAVGGSTFQGIRLINGSPNTPAAGITATIVFGGLCDIPNPTWAGQIVLCQRGNILFSDKADNVANSGGLAAVVFNSTPGLFIGTLVRDSAIPVVGISGADGQTIIASDLGQTATLLSLP